MHTRSACDMRAHVSSVYCRFDEEPAALIPIASSDRVLPHAGRVRWLRGTCQDTNRFASEQRGIRIFVYFAYIAFQYVHLLEFAWRHPIWGARIRRKTSKDTRNKACFSVGALYVRGAGDIERQGTYASGTSSALNKYRYEYATPAPKPPRIVPMSGATKYEYMPKARAGAIVRAGLILAAKIRENRQRQHALATS